jgi:Carboxypeptidase regulatory-like domain/TonB dependent receptor-like, beta-barrel
MGPPRSLLVPVLLAFSLLQVATAAAQEGGKPEHVIQLASVTSGSIVGSVLDDHGQPLGGVVISALGSSSAFAVTDRIGQFTLRSLLPGPYLLRAHLPGYLPARNAMVSVRPSARTTSSFTLRREGAANEARVSAAGLGATGMSAAPDDERPRDESETAWRLRHLRRSILKDATTLAEAAAKEDDWFLTNSFGVLGRAMESSARVAGSLFSELPLQGQVNLLTTGAFDSPFQLLEMERTRSVAFFAVGAPVGGHGDWTVKAALNHGDLSSWLLTGNYVRRESARHQYQFGMSYGVHRYEGGNAVAMAAVPDAARNVGTLFGSDEWTITKNLSLGFGASYAHYDYLPEASHLSPRLTATIRTTDRTRLRTVASRQVVAPGADEFLPPARTPVLPPFTQRVDDQLVTVFGFRNADTPASELGHYYLASAGNVDVRGWGVSITHTLAENVRGSVDYSFAIADWTPSGRTHDQVRLAHRVPAGLRQGSENIHDVTTSIESIVPQTATRVFFLLKMNSAFLRADGGDRTPGPDRRFDMQVTQGLPFMNFLKADWEMLVEVRNLFRETTPDGSVYDELLVARPPKRLIGGLTVKF